MGDIPSYTHTIVLGPLSGCGRNHSIKQWIPSPLSFWGQQQADASAKGLPIIDTDSIIETGADDWHTWYIEDPWPMP